jgi:SAM-dependent methyltransferase
MTPSRIRLLIVTRDERWLDVAREFVVAQLPAPPGRVVEIGCGRLGGLVPALRSVGYDATGVDPDAPEGPWYVQAEFEHYDITDPVDAIVACTSLHHVADLGEVLDRIEAGLVSGGMLAVVEWARERFDEATAQWCFSRLPPDDDEDHPGWLSKRQADWHASSQPWDVYLQAWADAERLHPGCDILAELEARFDGEPTGRGPYFFADLADTSEADEQQAIDSGQIQATRIQYAGRRR